VAWAFVEQQQQGWLDESFDAGPHRPLAGLGDPAAPHPGRIHRLTISLLHIEVKLLRVAAST
jgi:hypothetical protein